MDSRHRCGDCFARRIMRGSKPSFTSLYFSRRLSRGSLADDFESDVRILCAVIVNLLPEVGDDAAWWQRERAVRIVFRPRTYPPSSRYHGDVPVVRMKVWMAHMMRGPSGEEDVDTGLGRVTRQDCRVRLVLPMNPFDLVRQLVRYRGRVEIGGGGLGRSNCHGYRDCERDEPVKPAHPRC